MFDDSALIRFSTRTLTGPHRNEMVRELVGRAFFNVEFTPLADTLHLEMATRFFPGVSVTDACVDPHRLEASYDQSRASDDFVLLWAPSPGRGYAEQFGKMVHADGSTALMSCADRVVCETHESFHHITVKLQRHLLLPLLPHAEAALMQVVPPENEALRLLTSYLASHRQLENAGAASAPRFAQTVATHIVDLVALIIGTNADATELASKRSLRVARLDAVKRWVLARLVSPELNIEAAAKAFGLSSRSIQLLFAAEAMTFTEFVLRQRLALAHRRLFMPVLAERTISDIAFGCGFGDLSYFNRSFRNIYGKTPSDVRHGLRSTGRH